MSLTLEEAIQDTVEKVEEELQELLRSPEGPESHLYKAMRYACFNGGKRLRPFLLVTTADMFDVDEKESIKVSAAVEMIHAYSLIHDDLPCMDNSDLRRGKPSCHKEFDEATAILAGDALQAYSFEVLTHEETHSDPKIRAHLTFKLAQAVGQKGMVGGQMLDLKDDKSEFDAHMLTRMQHLKTGALINFCGQAGCILGYASKAKRYAIQAYMQDLGLAYQITDDLLDIYGSSQKTGKTQGQDERNGKITYISAMGEEKARLHLKMLKEQSIEHLEIFGREANLLREFVHYILEREN